MDNNKVRHTIGCDPEFFLKDENGKLVSAIGIIPGTKEEPYGLPNGAGLQVDNVALEFSSPVASKREDFVDILRATFADIFENIPKGYTIAAEPSAIFDDKQLEHPDAQRFGCTPDFDAWTLQVNEKMPAENPNLRSCGGHVHVGHVPGDGNDFLLDPYGKLAAVKTMDTLHGIISTMLDSGDAAIARRQLYGSAGCHRPTHYGIEYRVLSNFWMKSPMLVMLIDSLTQDALALIQSGQHEGLIADIGEDTIINTINNGDVEAAKSILDTHLYAVLSEDSRFYLASVYDKELSNDLQKTWLEMAV
ncbi:MAG TPA: hypothetical protein VI911_00565 [Patescibacteria group bacterium]|nr:hypothetical protein [Patescibacteria group bacterium]